MMGLETNPFVQEVLRTSLAVAALVLLVLIIRRPFAKRFGAKAAYALWLVPLARFIMPPLPSNWALAGWLGFGRETVAPAAGPMETFGPMPLASSVSLADPVAAAPSTIAPLPVEAASLPAPEAVAGPVITEMLASFAMSWGLPVLLVVWVLGALLWLGMSLRRQDVFQNLIWNDSEAASPEILAETDRVAQQIGLKRAPHVRVSLLCSGPLVTGLKNPVVLLPMWFEDDYTKPEQRDALVHELMHLKRHDLWAFQIARIVAATQWFNPLAHLALQAFRTDQESACDADVLAQETISPAAYGRTLVKAARLARPSDRRIAAASLTLAHPIKERLIMMTHPTPTLRSRLMGTALVAGISAAALFATASCTSTAQENDLAGGPKNIKTVETIEDDGTMSFSITVDGQTFDMDLTDLPPMPAMPEMPPVPGMVFVQDGQSFSMSIDSDEIDTDSPEFAKWEDAMEAWGEKMEDWGELVEDRADAWAAKYEPEMEEFIEARTEMWAEQIEARVERDMERVERDIEKAERKQEQAERRAERAAEKAQMRERGRIGQKADNSGETRQIDVRDFDRVEVSGGLSVIYSQAPNPSVSATLERGSWDDVSIVVDGRTLKVKRADKKRWNDGRGPQLKVYASSKDLTNLAASSGSAFDGSVATRTFKIDASAGSAVSLSGSCTQVSIDASSGSSISVAEFQCEKASVDASSGTSVTVYASELADLDASSGSSISLRGGASDVTADRSSGASISVR